MEVGREDLTRHYAETLERWRSRFEAAADRAQELGYDQRFRRLWSFYLSYCEAGFRERRIGDFQLLMAKPAARRAARPGAPRLQQWPGEPRTQPHAGRARPWS